MKNVRQVLSAIVAPGKRRRRYSTTMRCLDCGLKWQASRVSDPCPGCASKAVLVAARWNPVKYGMPVLDRRAGKAGVA
ncbi:hypothetical protein [uncultured Desulfobacter sp.]|uniref:hypothetical protein n=1 Tax=uncultured Desulfobacter sp. TaxID=240139 RepID=UPI002AAB816D|nr:hypothetical protein [uncultured Desulfobacter sp.]